MPETHSDTWLSLDEAARRVGVSRMRMREAIAVGLCDARKDNHGVWRVALGAGIARLKTRIEQARVAPDALIDLLFDEIEEVNFLLADRDANIERMSVIVARQQEIIARTLTLAETRQTGEAGGDMDRVSAANDRSVRLIEAAFAKLSARDNEVFKLTGMLDRAFATIAKLEGEVKLHAGVAERQQGLLERLFALAHSRIERLSQAEPRGGGLLSRLRERVTGSRSGGTRA